ncbi:hypothetical protein YB2330_003412 [Saitoella coloradoensis]
MSCDLPCCLIYGCFPLALMCAPFTLASRKISKMKRERQKRKAEKAALEKVAYRKAAVERAAREKEAARMRNGNPKVAPWPVPLDIPHGYTEPPLNKPPGHEKRYSISIGKKPTFVRALPIPSVDYSHLTPDQLKLAISQRWTDPHRMLRDFNDPKRAEYWKKEYKSACWAPCPKYSPKELEGSKKESCMNALIPGEPEKLWCSQHCAAKIALKYGFVLKDIPLEQRMPRDWFTCSTKSLPPRRRIDKAPFPATTYLPVTEPSYFLGEGWTLGGLMAGAVDVATAAGYMVADVVSPIYETGKKVWDLIDEME